MNSTLKGLVAKAQADAVYKPGEVVPLSGIYEVVHDSIHPLKHEVTVIKGKKFPPCNHCGTKPRFSLVRPAVHIESHESFM